MKRLALVLTSVAAALAIGTTASAGGWAISSLDEMPVAEPGASTEVGFTILQHGATPAAGLDDVAVEITAADGTVTSFPATPDGAPGHYVATVTFPASGEASWRVLQGWFGPHELGTISVGAAAPAATAGASSTSWSWVDPALLSATLLLAGVAIVDLFTGRRRRAAAAT